MKKIFKHIALICLLALLYTQAQATKYFFSIAGLVGNSGTSQSATWPESKISTFLFAPGDTVAIRRGDILTGSNITFTRSGASGNNIVFDAYGNGHNPMIDGGGLGTPALYFNGCSYITVNNIQIQNSSTSAQAPLSVNNCHDIRFYNCYGGLGKRGMVITNCTGNIVVTNCYFSKFTDAISSAGNTPANGGGSGVQWQSCSGSGNKVLYSNFYTDISTSTYGVGDIISPYQCYFGTGDSFPAGNFGLEIAYNNIRGGGSSPPASGFCAITGGDVGGSNQYIHDNIAVNPGAVGMQIQGGTNINMSNNIIYSKNLSYTSVGLSFGNYSGQPVSGIVMGGNLINFYSATNGQLFNKWWDGATKTYPAFQPTNWTTNTADRTADPGSYDAKLPDPLWTGSPWDAPILAYTSNTATFSQNSTISPQTIVNTGTSSTSYTISPALPSGLSFDTTSGTISGKPTATQAATSYTVTATNAKGYGQTAITITVTGSILVSKKFVLRGGKLIIKH